MTSATRDISGGRLAPADYARNFADAHPPLGRHEALVEADRCYFCHDAPCMTACPTGIDVPLFIRQIAAGDPNGAARTIFEQNILGGMCARVCPVETLCEAACVREAAEGRPVRIGLLQRHATDTLMESGDGHPFVRAAPTGRRVAVVGAGPAGLACAHRLALHGHEVSVFEARDKPGGLNEYGIAAYKTVGGFARRELEFILALGGIRVETGKRLGRDIGVRQLLDRHDAVFLAIGLAGVNGLDVEGEDADGCDDAVGAIAELRQADDLAGLPVGRRVVVVGGGMTAIDMATQIRLLGAEEATIVYRRGREAMNASERECQRALSHGVAIRYWLQPRALVRRADGTVAAIELACTRQTDAGLATTGETVTLAADQVFKAVGQRFDRNPLAGDAIAMDRGRIAVGADRRTSLDRVWAGGDCVRSGDDLTVVAVEDGKIAAESIHAALTA